MITRQDAFRIAAKTARACGIGSRVTNVWAFEELAERYIAEPRAYELDPWYHWIAYIEQPFIGFQSSLIVAISRDTGAVSYVGSAQDEG